MGFLQGNPSNMALNKVKDKKGPDMVYLPTIISQFVFTARENLRIQANLKEIKVGFQL